MQKFQNLIPIQIRLNILHGDLIGGGKRCKECQIRNQPNHRPRGKMKTYVVGEPLERISLDILGPKLGFYTN
jgi:hypothetical protein